MKAGRIGLVAVVLVAAAGAGGVFGFLIFSETAAIRITTPETYIETTAAVRGSLTGGQFRTERLHVALTESANASPTRPPCTTSPYPPPLLASTNTPFLPSTSLHPPP